MITVHTNSDGALIEVELSGQVTSSDYTNTLVPAIEAALAEHNAVRLLAIVQPEFKGYDLGAAWSDTKLGLSHWRGFERIGVVADQGWVQTSIRLAAPILPCPVQVFEMAELEAARRWMRESLGSIHVTDLGDPCVQVSLLGKLDPEEYKQAEKDLDALLQDRSGFRLLIDLRDFDGVVGPCGSFQVGQPAYRDARPRGHCRRQILATHGAKGGQPCTGDPNAVFRV